MKKKKTSVDFSQKKTLQKQTINPDVQASPGMQAAVKDDTEEEQKTKQYSFAGFMWL